MRALLLVLAVTMLAPLHAAEPGVFAHPSTATSFARDLATATRGLAGAQTLRGSYEQLKTLRGLPRPLRAEGTFLFVRGAGIAWRTVVPFDSELVITGQHILQRENGRVSMRLSAAQQPSVRIVAEIFSAVFALDFEGLAARFELFSRRVRRGWELGLRPRPGAGGALREIVVSGNHVVERVRVADANGDHTDIRLHDTAVSTAAPSAEDVHRFQP